MRTATRLLIGCGLLFGLGCGALDDIDPFNDDAFCSPTGGEVDVSGEWNLTGWGTRSECGDPVLDTNNFEMSSRGVLGVSADLDAGTLSLSTTIDDFEFSGTIDRTCVTFTTSEPNDGITYNWSGQVEENRTIRGTFDGTGPNNCLSSGEFTIVIE